MSEKSCRKSVPGLACMPKSTKKVSPPVTFILSGIYTSAWDWSCGCLNGG